VGYVVGDVVILYYDLLLVKFCVWGIDCDEVIIWVREVFKNFVVDGLWMNIDFFFEVFDDFSFIDNSYDI